MQHLASSSSSLMTTAHGKLLVEVQQIYMRLVLQPAMTSRDLQISSWYVWSKDANPAIRSGRGLFAI